MEVIIRVGKTDVRNHFDHPSKSVSADAARAPTAVSEHSCDKETSLWGMVPGSDDYPKDNRSSQHLTRLNFPYLQPSNSTNRSDPPLAF